MHSYRCNTQNITGRFDKNDAYFKSSSEIRYQAPRCSMAQIFLDFKVLCGNETSQKVTFKSVKPGWV